ncbi:hypothetical protein BV25DRAFT_689628 [Artomyces pyxidatus]|uniref:Uncharacterized protein n=1 Tax=Artomyces pyxidatus TaxID=48021 RepID=A0ACB8SZT2_9AGAM|nr:hypothetical protein BV25DRAFT_689628 [Artomyces pyxidatus]
MKEREQVKSKRAWQSSRSATSVTAPPSPALPRARRRRRRQRQPRRSHAPYIPVGIEKTQAADRGERFLPPSVRRMKIFLYARLAQALLLPVWLQAD